MSNRLLDIVCFMSAAVAQVLLGKYLQNYALYANDELRVLPILASATPVVLVYLLVRFAFPPLLSVTLLVLVLLVLSIVNRMKISLANDPLSWTDLSSTANLSVVWHYFSLRHVVILAGAAIICLVAWRVNPRNDMSSRRLFFNFMACMALAPISLYSYSDQVGKSVSLMAEEVTKRLGVLYISWDWAANIEYNGLPLHLMQTSRRQIPEDSTDDDVLKFDTLRDKVKNSVIRPNKIIFILCEACWHDEKHFHEPFSKLEDLGFKQARALSPVYGGSTVNATFELLAGLPANGSLSGVIYQEYSSLISDSAHALPRYLKGFGYTTIEMHNHGKRFWRRDVVAPKLGFDEFVGLEDMGRSVSPIWADDGILFDHALGKIKESGLKTFFFLTTVSTHGPYRFDGDYGQGDYRDRLSTALDRLSDFVGKIKDMDPEALILIVGDHKPALNKYFYEEGVLPRDQFDAIGDENESFIFSNKSSPELRGDVPVYVYHHDESRVNRLVDSASGKPFFCLVQYLDDEFISSGVPALEFSRSNAICNDFKYGEYDSIVSRYPDWLYSLSILSGN